MMLYSLSFSPKYMLSVFSNHLHPQLSMSLPPHQLISWNSPISSILFLSQIWPYHHSRFSLLDCELFEGRYLPCFIYLSTVLNECLLNIEQRKAISQTKREIQNICWNMMEALALQLLLSCMKKPMSNIEAAL